MMQRKFALSLVALLSGALLGQAQVPDKTFTPEELAKFNGENNNPAYVAVNGIVYDVTRAKGWKKGHHKGVSAGTDLTKGIGEASHGTRVLKNLPVVGKMADQ